MPKTVSITPDVAAVLARCTTKGNVVFLPEGEKLDRKLYDAVNKVLVAIGGKWVRGTGGHVFADGLGEQLTDAIAAGSVVDQKRTLEQFYTPRGLALRMCNAVEVVANDFALEPSAGRGAIVSVLLERGADVLAVDIDPRNVTALYDLPRRSKPSQLYSVQQGDFLTMPPLDAIGHQLPSVAVMNPPFSRNQDIAHVRRAFDMLAPGGRLAAIMSAHWTFGQEPACAAFRQFIGYPDMRGVRHPAQVVNMRSDPSVASASTELLPAGTFRESGTNVAAVLVVLHKANR